MQGRLDIKCYYFVADWDIAEETVDIYFPDDAPAYHRIYSVNVYTDWHMAYGVYLGYDCKNTIKIINTYKYDHIIKRAIIRVLYI